MTGTRSLLTPRQRQIIAAMNTGMHSKAIAFTLGITPGTLKQYANDCYARLAKAGVKSQCGESIGSRAALLAWWHSAPEGGEVHAVDDITADQAEQYLAMLCIEDRLAVEDDEVSHEALLELRYRQQEIDRLNRALALIRDRAVSEQNAMAYRLADAALNGLAQEPGRVM